jgi:hypothetical protein
VFVYLTATWKAKFDPKISHDSLSWTLHGSFALQFGGQRLGNGRNRETTTHKMTCLRPKSIFLKNFVANESGRLV